MPNRILKESVKRSEQIDQLSWFEEVVFYRLILTADDYGCLDGRVVLLKNELFPTKDNVTKKAVEDAISKLDSVGLLCKYTVNGKPYLFFPTWEKHQRLRNKHRKYPDPAEAAQADDGNLTVKCQSNDGQMSANRQPELELEDELELEEKAPINTERDRAHAHEAIPGMDGGDSKYGRKEFEEDLSALTKPLAEAVVEWMKYKKEKHQPYKPRGIKSLITQVSNYAKQYGEEAMIQTIANSMANGYMGITFDKAEKNSGAEGRVNRGHPEPPTDGTRGADRSAAWGIKSIID